MRPVRRIVLIAVALLAVAPAAASARLTKLPGTGETPTVEVDAAGTAFVACLRAPHRHRRRPHAPPLAKGRFRSPRTVPGSAGSIIGTTLAQDAKGRFAVAWFDSRGNRIRIAASRTGRRWSRARTIGHVSGIPSVMSIGLGPDGRGLVVTDQGLRTRPLLVGRVNVKQLTRKRRR